MPRAQSPSRAAARALLAAAALALLPSPLHAVTKTWIGAPNGNWKVGPWSPAGTPAPGDAVVISVTPSTLYPITLNADYGPGPGALASLTLSSTNTIPLLLTQSDPAHNLRTVTETIATGGGFVDFLHSAGTHAVSDSLLLATGIGANATYSLSNTASLSAGSATLAQAGRATFSQTGGNHTVAGTLTAADLVGSFARYSLSAGTLSAASLILANHGNATFTHSGGAASADTLRLAAGDFSSSTYFLSGPSATLTTSHLRIADGGTGLLSQSAGAVSVLDTLNLGNPLVTPFPSTASYSLTGGSLSAPTATIASRGAATFDHSAGTFTAGDLLLGAAATNAKGSYALSDTASLSTGRTTLTGPGATFTQSGGSHAVTFALRLLGTPSGPSAYSLSAGHLTTPLADIAHGAVTHTGGTLAATQLNLASASGTTSTYSLAGTPANLTSTFALLGSAGHASFSHTAGTFTTTNLTLASGSSSSAAYSLAGGTLNTTTSDIGAGGAAAFLHSAGTHAAASRINIAASSSFGVGASYTLSGTAALTTPDLTLGGFTPRDGGAPGTLTITGGAATVTGTLDVNPDTDSALNLAGGTLSVATLALHDRPDHFRWTAGTLNLLGGYTVNDDFLLGPEPTLLPGMTLSASAPAANLGSIRLRSGAALAGTATLTNHNTIALAGPAAAVHAPLVNSPGGILSGAGSLTGPVHNAGSIILRSGTLSLTHSLNNPGTILVPVNATLRLTTPTSNPGTIHLTGGTLDTAGQPLTNTGLLTGQGALLVPSLVNHAILALTAGPSTLTGQLSGPGALSLLPGASLTLSPNAGPSSTSSLSLSPTSTLDLTNNPLSLPSGVVASATTSTIRSYLLNNQLLSSLSSNTHRLGYLLNNSTLTIRLTLTGDANLDGKLDEDDYALLDQGFATGGQFWFQGDFTHDGQVDHLDYLLLDRTYLSSQAQGSQSLAPLLSLRTAQFGPTYVSHLLTSIPEPSSLSSILYPLFSYSLLPRRRRRAHPDRALPPRPPAPPQPILNHTYI